MTDQYNDIRKVDGGYKVTVYDHGFVTMCEYDKTTKEWKDCIFPTFEIALQERNRYYEIKRG